MIFWSSRQLQFDEAEVVVKAPQEPQAPSQNTRKRKSSYDKWTNEEQSFLVDLWAEKHDRLESKDARKVWQEICDEIEINFGMKKTVEKCQRKIKYLIDKYNDAKTWNKTQSGGQLKKISSMTKLIVFLREEMLWQGHAQILQSRFRLPQAPKTPLHLVVVLGLQAHSQAPVGRVEQVVLNHPTPQTAPAEPGKSGIEQQREKYPKMEKMKRQFRSRGASNRLKSRAKS